MCDSMSLHPGTCAPAGMCMWPRTGIYVCVSLPVSLRTCRCLCLYVSEWCVCTGWSAHVWTRPMSCPVCTHVVHEAATPAGQVPRRPRPSSRVLRDGADTARTRSPEGLDGGGQTNGLRAAAVTVTKAVYRVLPVSGGGGGTGGTVWRNVKVGGVLCCHPTGMSPGVGRLCPEACMETHTHSCWHTHVGVETQPHVPAPHVPARVRPMESPGVSRGPGAGCTWGQGSEAGSP